MDRKDKMKEGNSRYIRKKDEDTIPIQSTKQDISHGVTKTEIKNGGNRCKAPEKKKKPLGKMDESISRPVPSTKFQTQIRTFVKSSKCCLCGKSLEECDCTSDEARKEMTKLHETMYKVPEDKNELQLNIANKPTSAEETTEHKKTSARVHDDSTVIGQNDTTALVKD